MTTPGAAASAGVVGAIAAALLIAGCGSSDSAARPSTTGTSSSPSSSATASASASAPVAAVGNAPLTGIPVASAAVLHRSAVSVVVSMAPGQPVTGIAAADVVYAEFDQPSHVRLVALYQSTEAASVGPVGGTAPVDPKILTLFSTPAFGFAGGPTGFVAQSRPPSVAPRDATGAYASLYHAGGGGLLAATATLRASDRGAATPLSGLFTFASDAAPAPTAAPALHRLVVSVPGHAALTWVWTGHAWGGPGGSLVSNVVVQWVTYKTITPHKAPTVASAQVVGAGVARVFAGAHGVLTTWQRPFPGVVTVYKVGAQPVGMVPGRTWVILAPSGTRVTTS